jgi:hypothetical protein
MIPRVVKDTFSSRRRIAVLLLVAATGFGLLTPAAAAENVTLQNVTFESGDTTYRMPTIEFVGSNLNQAQLATFFDKKMTEPYTLRLNAMSISSVTIPELVMERTTPAGKRTSVIRNIVAKDIVRGRVDSVTAAGGTFTRTDEDGTFGPINIKGLDLVWIASLYEGRDSDERRIFTSFSLDALRLKTAKGANFGIERIASNDLRARSGSLRDWPAQPGGKVQRYLPAVGSVTISGFSADLPNSRVKDGRHKWAMKSLSLTADRLRNGIPTTIRLALDEFMVPLQAPVAASVQHGPTDLRDFGYNSVKVSVLLDGAWNEQANEFAVKGISVSFADIGTIALSGTLGNITKDIFSGDAAAMTAQFGLATAKVFSVTFEDRGLYERALAVHAKKKGRLPEDIRKEFDQAAAKTISVMLGDTPNAKTIGKAVADFIAKPGILEISAKSKSRGGVPLTDFRPVGAAPAPSANKLNITATAR